MVVVVVVAVEVVVLVVCVVVVLVEVVVVGWVVVVVVVVEGIVVVGHTSSTTPPLSVCRAGITHALSTRSYGDPPSGQAPAPKICQTNRTREYPRQFTDTGAPSLAAFA